jgi:type VI secretion system protein ImpK
MPSDTFAVSLTNHLTVPMRSAPLSHYRSKLFIAPPNSNPLIAAASPLFSLLERISLSPTIPTPDVIQPNIEHELQAFLSRITTQGYSDELSVISHYLLCATIDEILGKNYIRIQGKPAEFKAFTPFSSGDTGPEKRFFEIINFIKDKINQYLDLLELAYYCLVAGFEGEQHMRPDGRQFLDNLIEEIYQIIKINKVQKPPRLFKEKRNVIPEPTNYKPLLTTAMWACGLVVVLFFGSYSLLEHKAKTVLAGHNALVNWNTNG